MSINIINLILPQYNYLYHCPFYQKIENLPQKYLKKNYVPEV